MMTAVLVWAVPAVISVGYVSQLFTSSTVSAVLPDAHGPGDADGPEGSSRSRAARSGTLSNGSPVVKPPPGVLIIDGVVSAESSGGRPGVCAGSGVLLSADGYVLTNYHVVEGTTRLTATLSATGGKFDAKVVGTDQSRDVALLKLQDAKGLTPMKVAPEGAKVGQPVTAIGNGGGQDTLFSVSGTVQQLDEKVQIAAENGAKPHTLSGMIRTNAAVVPGYSGGPMVDARGDVVGISTAASLGGNPEGFAIPIAQATSIADQIKTGRSNGSIRVGPRPALGVTVTRGGWVQSVHSRGAAAKAGLAAGSTITSVGGVPVTDTASLQAAVASRDVGATVKVTWKDPTGQERSADITLGPAWHN
ncbi:hypothetical protein KEM60_02903 [Austwickia sp. TVS 96-490-7B]|nr:hypothetical protein [Austwickia sp. TVS 96-490-7B]